MINAVIDIGSTSVRLMLTDGERVEKKVNTTRLAENAGEGNKLNALNLERSAQAVAEYYFKAMERGAENIFAFATEAVRSARNRRVFTERVKELCGLEVDVLSKEEEAVTGFIGAYGGGVCCVIDMGGASTEVTIGTTESILYTKSLPYGIVRLSEVEKSGADMRAYITQRLMGYGEIPAFDNLVAIGGTITTIGAMLKGLADYNPNAINGFEITKGDIEGLYPKIAAMTVAERRRVPGLPEKRADLIAPGILMYGLLLNYLGRESLCVSEGDSTEGYLIRKKLLPDGFKAVYEELK